MNADLHCHSYYSDGTRSPAFAVQRAIDNGLSHLALTDHDCTDGLSELPPGNDAITIIPGVEISSSWEGQEIHVVGLSINPHAPGLQRLLANQQQLRRTRMQAMDEKLSALGITGLMAHLNTLPSVALTRSHVADFLVRHKACKTRQKAFKTHIGKGGKAYVAVNWCSLADAVAAIGAAGGIAVLAHPGRYPLNRKKRQLLVSAFKASGGDALEASYPNIDVNMAKELQALAIDHGLYVSAGSDFHDSAALWTDIGKFPPLGTLARQHAVWHHPAWPT